MKQNGVTRKKPREAYEIIWFGEITEKRNAVAINVSPPHAEMATENECISGRMQNREFLCYFTLCSFPQIFPVKAVHTVDFLF
jgi:hypothetical protein